MDKKVCIKCQEFKHLSEFRLNSEGAPVFKTNGEIRITNVCWGCRSLQKKSTYLTLEGKLRYIYKHQIKNSKSRGHNPPEYSEQELVNKFIDSPKYIKLYNIWKSSGFKPELAPSIDRKEDFKEYSFDNITLMTWQENNSKEHAKHKEGTSINEDLKPVWQYSMNGEYVNNYISQNEAARQVSSVTQQTISLCCMGKIKSSGNFRWFYTRQQELQPIEDYTYYHKIYEYCPITKSLISVFNLINEISEDTNEQVSIRRAIRNNTLYKERLFSITELTYQDILDKINNLKGVSPITQYDKNYNLISYYKSASEASKVLGIADTTIKRYAVSHKVYNENYIFRLKFNDEIAEQIHKYQLINAKHLKDI